MVIVGFQVSDKLQRLRFLSKTFLLANPSINVILRMLFLIFSNTNIVFIDKKFTSKSYTATKALLITRRVKIIDKIKFAKVALNENFKVFWG